MANTTIKNLGVSIAALLFSYGIGKISDKNTSFIPTQTALKNVALQSAQELINAELQKAAGVEPTTTDTTTISQ